MQEVVERVIIKEEEELVVHVGGDEGRMHLLRVYLVDIC